MQPYELLKKGAYLVKEEFEDLYKNSGYDYIKNIHDIKGVFHPCLRKNYGNIEHLLLFTKTEGLYKIICSVTMPIKLDMESINKR